MKQGGLLDQIRQVKPGGGGLLDQIRSVGAEPADAPGSMMDQEIVPYSAPDMASLGDVAQSVGSGLLEGAGAALDIPRRVGRALGDAINYEGLVADALGVPPEERAGFVQGARSSVPPSFTEMARDAIPPVPGMEDSILFSRAPKIVGGAAALGPVASAAGAGGLVAALGAGGAARGYEDAQRAGAGPGATLAASAGSAALDALGVLGPLGMAARGGTSLAREVIGGGLVGGVQSLGSQALAKATYSPEQEISYVRALDEALANAVAGGILSAPEAMAMREAASSRAQEGTTAPARSAEESGISERTEPSPFPLDQGALALDPLLQKATSPTGVYVNPEGTSAQPFAPDAVFAERAGLRFPREPRMEPRVRRETVAEARPETPEFLAAEQARADRLAAMESLRSDPVTAALADQARAGDHRALERLQDEARMIFTDADLAFLVGKRARPSEIDGPAAAPPARPAPADTTSQTALPAAEVDAGAPSPKPSAVEIVTKGSRPSLEQREAGRALPRRLKADLDAGRVLENVQRAANGEDVGTTPGSLVSPDASLEAQAMRAGVRETRAETPGAGAEPVSREAQETAALELVRREGPEALGDRLVGKVRRGTQQLLAHEQVALGRLAQERALAALNSGDPAAFERATLLEHAYQNARAEAGRGLGVIRSPQTPQEAVAQALLEPTRSTRLRIEKLQKARRDEIARLEAEKPKPPRRERIAKVEADIDALILEMGRKAKATARTGLDPAVLADATKLAGLFIKKGTLEFQEFADAAVQRLGEHIRPYLKDAWATARPEERKARALESRIDQISKLEAQKLATAREKLQKAGYDPAKIAEGAYTDRGDLAAIGRIISSTKSSKWDWYTEYRIGSMLSAPITAARNIAGNASMLGVQNVERVAEMMANAVVRDPKSAQFGEARAYYGSWMQGFAKASDALVEAFRTEQPVFEQDFAPDRASRSEFVETAAIPGKAGRVIRTPMRVNLAFDQFFTALASWTEGHALAYRKAKAEGLEGKALESRVAEIMADPTDPIRNEALKKGEETTFKAQAEHSKIVAGVLAVRGALDSVPQLGNFPLGTTLLPFVRTPYSIFKVGVGYPIHPLVALTRGAKGAYKGNRQLLVKDAARTMVSLGISAAVWNLVSSQDEEGNPRLTGSKPGQGLPPYSLRVGDGWYSYKQIQPLSAILSTVADASEGARTGKEPVSEALARVLPSIVQQAEDSTFLRTLGDIKDAIDNPEGGKTATLARNTLALPLVPNVIRNPAAQSDTKVRANVVRKHEDSGSWNAMLASLPYYALPLAANAPPPRYDLWGREVQKQGSSSPFLWRLVNPAPSSGKVSDATSLDLLVRNWNEKVLRGEAGDAKEFVPRPPAYWYELGGKTRYWSDEDYATLSRLSGQLALETLTAASLDINDPKPEHIKEIERVISKARATVKAQMLAARAEK